MNIHVKKQNGSLLLTELCKECVLCDGNRVIFLLEVLLGQIQLFQVTLLVSQCAGLFVLQRRGKCLGFKVFLIRGEALDITLSLIHI